MKDKKQTMQSVGQVPVNASTQYIPFIKRAIREAKKAVACGDVPVGAVVVCDGRVVSAACNRREKDNDASAHAELLAIRKACKKLNRWNLSDCQLYVTLEPCAMCAGAIVNARIKTVVFGAFDRRFGCGGSLMNLLTDSGLNHSAEVVGGVMQDQCAELLTAFFKRLRNGEHICECRQDAASTKRKEK